jgi:hypothetical protein
MPSIKQSLSGVSSLNREFTGTVAFRNEKLSLPDGSKVAIGIDGERWVIVYQESPNLPFIVYEFNANKQLVIVDKKMGETKDIERVKVIVNYFFEHTDVDDVMTIEAGGNEE